MILSKYSQYRSLQSTFHEQANIARASIEQENMQLKGHNLRLEDQITKYDSHIKRLNADIAEMELHIQTQPRVTAEDFVPASVWRSPYFDRELQSSVLSLANNENMQTSSKIANSFRVISQHYQKLLTEQEQRISELILSEKQFHDLVDRSIVDISIAISGSPSSVEEFKDDSGERIVTQIQQLKKSFDENKRRCSTLEQIVYTIKETFNLGETHNDNELISELQDFITRQQHKDQELESRNRRVKELKQTLDSLQKQARDEISTLQQQTSALSVLHTTV